jgi:hypothetical protein
MTTPFDDFLDRDFTCDPKDTLKAAIREQTTRVLRRRRRLRQLGFVGMAAACYAAGLATMWTLLPRPTATVDSPTQPLVIADSRNPSPPDEKTPVRPDLYEFQAQTAPPAERAAQLREAGDLYLEQSNDYANALRCYTQAFDAADPQALEYSPDDNWLVMGIKNTRRTLEFSPDDNWLVIAIKHARRKEKINVQ